MFDSEHNAWQVFSDLAAASMRGSASEPMLSNGSRGLGKSHIMPALSIRMTSAFQFQRFWIHQQRAAMKVGFDAVLLGCWANVSGCRRALDIGTGTGIVALMLAQRTETSQVGTALIDAIDSDLGAYRDAEENVNASPWWNRMRVFHRSLSEFAAVCDQTYDLIACNPPFFESGSPSPEPSRRVARHGLTLTLPTLMEMTARLLAEAGQLSVILPFSRSDEAVGLAAQSQLHCRRRLLVRPLPDKAFKRVLLEFRRQPGPIETDSLCIEQRRHCYTPEFHSLTEQFYLKRSSRD